MRTEPWGVISRTLVRTDKNGTKYYTGIAKCDRCGGAGGANQWEYTGWTCYKCGGKGQYATEWCERTPEYEAKLDARRIARLEKEAEYAKAHEEEIKREETIKACGQKAKAIDTCNDHKACRCENCPHKVYCGLLTEALYTFEDGQKMGVLTEEQTSLYERLLKVDRTEPVTIETLDGEPCKEGKWFDNAWGSSTRCITKPNGEKVYTSATTDRGLAKYGLRNRKG